jgi:hypothetical protein
MRSSLFEAIGLALGRRITGETLPISRSNKGNPVKNMNLLPETKRDESPLMWEGSTLPVRNEGLHFTARGPQISRVKILHSKFLGMLRRDLDIFTEILDRK